MSSDNCHCYAMNVKAIVPFLQRLFCHEIPSCPVCLYIPTAGTVYTANKSSSLFYGTL